MWRYLGNTTLFLLSLIFSLLFGLCILKLYTLVFTVSDPIYFYRAGQGIWRSDSFTGYRNKANLELSASGDLIAHTNSQGFRERRRVDPKAKPGILRFIGVGDSITWGPRVNRVDTYLGALQTLLTEDSCPVEIINGGVVGFSALQTRNFLEQYVVPLSPDIVVVNFCDNDWFPSLDPFNNTRSLYHSFFSQLRNEQKYPLTEQELGIIDELERAEKLWYVYNRHRKEPDMRRILQRLVLEIPILEMKALTDSLDARLIYLLIPDTFPTEIQRETHQALRAFFEQQGIEYIDLQGALAEDKATYPNSQRTMEASRGYNLVKMTGISAALKFLKLDVLDPVRALEQIAISNELPDTKEALSKHQQELNYIDSIGHPSIRGHRIIAKELYRYLTSGARAQAICSQRANDG